MYGKCWSCNRFIDIDEEFCLDCATLFQDEYEMYIDPYYVDENIGLIDEDMLKKKGITLSLNRYDEYGRLLD